MKRKSAGRTSAKKTKQPAAKAKSPSAAATKSTPKPPTLASAARGVAYTPPPIQGTGWAPFRYPLP